MLDLATIALHRGDTERVRELAAEYAAWDDTRTCRPEACGSGRA